MTRLPGFSWPRISTGLEILPPTLMVALGHPWLGAAVLGAVLASSALQSRMWGPLGAGTAPGLPIVRAGLHEHGLRSDHGDRSPAAEGGCDG
jgi:hypothetical protein